MRVSLQDEATVKQAGYKVEKWGNKGYHLIDPEGCYLMIGDYGCLSPTRWEAIAEGLSRIEQG